MTKTALYLAHLNPVTVAHAQIIEELRSSADAVVVMPVVFTRGDTELNSRSFPFTFEARREMIGSLFGDSVRVSRAYEFRAPFSQYVPPLLSRASWALRRRILDGVGGDYFTYTGDAAEWLMLRLYRLRPLRGRRKSVSATDVREAIYRAPGAGDTEWRRGLPEQVARIIARPRTWEEARRFAGAEDTTRRILGMKFPA